MNHKGSKGRGRGGVVKRETKKHDVVKRESNGQNPKPKPILWSFDPFNDVVNVKNELTRAILGFDDSKGMDVIVVPRHGFELRVSPNVLGHACVEPNVPGN